MRKQIPKIIAWIIVTVVVISALWVMWISPGIIAKLIIMVTVVVSLSSALTKDLQK